MCPEPYIKRGYSKYLTTCTAPKLAVGLDSWRSHATRGKSLLLDLGEAQGLLEKLWVGQCPWGGGSKGARRKDKESKPQWHSNWNFVPEASTTSKSFSLVFLKPVRSGFSITCKINYYSWFKTKLESQKSSSVPPLCLIAQILPTWSFKYFSNSSSLF